MKEVWVDIEGYEGYYQVSNLGRVRSLTRKLRHLNPHGYVSSRVLPGRIRKQYKNPDGYMMTSLCKSGKQKTVNIHRLVAEAFIPNPDNKPQVNHKDRHRNNNHVTNLEWVTRQENIVHSFTVGSRIIVKGEGSGRSKLKRKEVLELRRRYKNENISQTDLAKDYDVSPVAIGLIVNRKTWRHI